MKLRKAIKKIVALGTGATMLGATLFGAMAVDLNEYPAPLFVKNGEFDGIVVVGDSAAASDVIGAVDIATNLQFESKSSVPISASGASATTVVEGDAFKIEKSSNKLNMNELVDSPISTATADDLKALADGTIRNQKGTFSYNQYIDLANNSKVVYEIDSDQSDDPNAYLKFADGHLVYTYKLTFPTALESDVDSSDDLDDLDDKKITLLGQEYTILNTDNSSGLKLELMGGAIQDTMEEYTTKTYTLNGVDYEVEVVAISGAATPEVILKVNGEVTDKLVESDTYTLQDGTELGVKTILENEGTESGGGDIAEFYLGASKVVLEESSWDTTDSWNSIEVAEETMDAEVNFKGSIASGVVKISEIQVRWLADEDYFVPLGGMLSEQLDADEKGSLFLENIDYQFASLDRGSSENVELSPSSDNMRMKITTKTGGEFSFDAFHILSNAVGLGESNTKKLIVDTNLTLDFSNNLSKNEYFVLSEDKFSHLMQVNKFDSDDNQVWFKDIASGDITKVSAGDCDGTDDSDLILDGKTYVFRADCSGEEVGFQDFGSDQDVQSGAVLYTKEEGKVVFGEFNANVGSVWVLEEERDDVGGGDYLTGVNITVNQYNSEDKLKVASVAAYSTSGFAAKTWDSKDNYQTGFTNYGIFVEYDDEDQGKITVEYPSQEMEAAVYLTSGVTKSTTVEGAEGGDLMSTSVNAIPVGTAKLASEVSSATAQNMIVVGGPCANSVAATLMGRTAANCYEGFEEGKAIIKLYENGNNVAMLVAGATALDTRRAARVLADYSAYSLSGEEMQVVGTSTTFSDTVVSAVTMSIDDMEEEEEMEEMAEE